MYLMIMITDMLEVGVGSVTDAEGASQLALWSLMKELSKPQLILLISVLQPSVLV